MLAGEADSSHERHVRLARKLTGQTTPADTATIITGNFFGIATSFPRDLVPRKRCQLNL